jgi:ABC-type Fe3+-hydroxamate transport system substrate-binding protein
MGGNAARLCLLTALAIALAACASDSKRENLDPNIFPTNYKQEILDTLSRTLDDPANIRDAFISDPVLAPVAKDQRYIICVRYNSRNLRQQYAGSKDRIGYFYGGHLNQLVDATPEQCGNASYKPFPELEKLCQATKCP